jgi:hypothetical protein
MRRGLQFFGVPIKALMPALANQTGAYTAWSANDKLAFMTNSSLTEAQILEHVVMSDQTGMSPEAARAILDLRFDSPAVSRMNELAEKNHRENLTEVEREELEKYLRVGTFLNLMQAKARLVLCTND